MNHRFARLGQILIVFTQTATPIEPPESALDNPPSGQDYKTFGCIRPSHDLQFDPAALSQLPHPLDQFTSVRAIGPDQAQPRPVVAQHLEQQLCAVPAVRGSRRHADDQQQTQRVHQNLPFAPIDLLTRVIAVLAAPVCGLNRLRIKDRRRGLQVAALGPSQPLAQAVMDTFPDARLLSVSEVMIGNPPRRELMRQQAPGAARAHHVEDCVHNLASGIVRRAASGFGLGNQRSEPMPLGVAQVCWVWLTIHTQSSSSKIRGRSTF